MPALTSVAGFSVAVMRIGEPAERAGVSTRTLWHYESLGLVKAPRTANGHRHYGDADVRAVAEIRSLAGLGFALEETRPNARIPAGRARERRQLPRLDRGSTAARSRRSTPGARASTPSAVSSTPGSTMRWISCRAPTSCR